MTNFPIQWTNLKIWEIVIPLACLFLAFRVLDGSRRSWLLFALRIGALLFLIFPLFQIKVTKADSGVKPNLAVVLDASASMKAKDQNKEWRWQSLMKSLVLEREKLENKFIVQYYLLEDGLAQILSGDIESVDPKGRTTNFSHALEDLEKTRDLDAALIFSDGRDWGSRDPVSLSAALGRPIFTVGVGNENMKDALVSEVRASEFGFKSIPLDIVAEITTVGFGQQEITVYLKRGREILSSKRIDIGPGKEKAEAHFRFTPVNIGRQVLSVEVPHYKDEATYVNNRRELTLRVGRDRLRILYICGKPGPSYGFLRHQLKTDPSVELVSFVILREWQDKKPAQDSELSLIPFPSQDVLFRQLPTFDLLILEEFFFSLYGISNQTMNILKSYVDKGGALLLLGSEATFGANSPYRATVVSEISPLPIADPASIRQTGQFSVEVKALHHPIVQSSEGTPMDVENLPKLDGAFLPSKVRKNATVLLTDRESGRPVAAVSQIGKGRVMAMSTLSTWRWSLLSSGMGKTSLPYQRFWRNALRWLTRADEFRSVRLLTHMEERGEALLRVLVTGDHFESVSHAHVEVSVKYPDGSLSRLAAPSSSPGEYLTRLPLTQPGTYRIKAEARKGGRLLGRDSTHLVVSVLGREHSDLLPDFNLLRRIAQSSGGEFRPLSDFSAEWLDSSSAPHAAVRTMNLWNNPWLLIAAALLLLTEWGIRKRMGLP